MSSIPVLLLVGGGAVATAQAPPFTRGWTRPPATAAEIAFKRKIMNAMVERARRDATSCYRAAKKRGQKVAGAVFIEGGLVHAPSANEARMARVRIVESQVSPGLAACVLNVVRDTAYHLSRAEAAELASYPPGPVVSTPFVFPDDAERPTPAQEGGAASRAPPPPADARPAPR